MHTIAIPAYNAAGTLDRLLAHVERHRPPSVTDVVVCDNGSTDGTGEIVRRWSRRDPAIRLVSEPVPGKPAAWNRLFQEATTEYVIFLDADTLPGPGHLGLLVAATASGRHVAYCGRRRFRGTSPGAMWAARIADPVVELCLAGPCYAVHRARLQERMAERGYQQMPDVFAEDHALQAVLEPEEVLRVDGCVVEVSLDSMDALVVLLARRHLVRYELATEVPLLGRRLDALFPEVLRVWPQLWAVLGGPYSSRRKARWVAGGLAKAAVLAAYRKRIGAVARALIAQYDREGGGLVLRALSASSTLGERASTPAAAGP